MTLFLHAILIDASSELAMSSGHTIAITPSGAEVLNGLAPQYVIYPQRLVETYSAASALPRQAPISGR